MSPHVPSSQVGIVVTKTLTLILGGLITYYSYRAYQRTRARELQALAWGFGIMTFGALVGGVIDLVVPAVFGGDWLPASVFAQSLLTTIAFAVILYSLYID
jgi:TRAP-type C4-dicarboxylate transport system permease small subunit